MENNPKLIKYVGFNPNLLEQNDKRNIKRVRDEMEATVAKAYNKMGFPCFAGVPLLDSNVEWLV